MHTRTRKHAHKKLHTRTRIQKNAHTHAHTRTRTSTQETAHARTHRHTRNCTHAHAHKTLHTRTRTQDTAHANTHTAGKQKELTRGLHVRTHAQDKDGTGQVGTGTAIYSCTWGAGAWVTVLRASRFGPDLRLQLKRWEGLGGTGNLDAWGSVEYSVFLKATKQTTGSFTFTEYTQVQWRIHFCQSNFC